MCIHLRLVNHLGESLSWEEYCCIVCSIRHNLNKSVTLISLPLNQFDKFQHPLAFMFMLEFHGSSGSIFRWSNVDEAVESN